MSTPFFAGLVPVEFGGGGGRCCLQGRRCPFRLLSIADGGAVNATDGGGRGRGRIQHRSHRQAHWFSLPEWGRGVFTLETVQNITVPFAKQHDGDGHLGRPCIWAGPDSGAGLVTLLYAGASTSAAPGDPLCRRASASTDIQRNTLIGAPHFVLPFYKKIHLKLMLSQFIPVEPGSGGGRCCLQGRRCPSRILSNADGGAVNTTAADG